jgi:hypothetical protein
MIPCKEVRKSGDWQSYIRSGWFDSDAEFDTLFPLFRDNNPDAAGREAAEVMQELFPEVPVPELEVYVRTAGEKYMDILERDS